MLPTTREECEQLGYQFDVTTRKRRETLFFVVTVMRHGEQVGDVSPVDITERDALQKAIQLARVHYSRNR